MRGSPLCNNFFQLIKCVQREIETHGKDVELWSDGAQEQFLRRNNAQSWFSAPDPLIQRAIDSVTQTAKMFGFAVGLNGLDFVAPEELNIQLDIHLPPNDEM